MNWMANISSTALNNINELNTGFSITIKLKYIEHDFLMIITAEHLEEYWCQKQRIF